MLDAAELRRNLDYDPETGVFTWKIAKSGYTANRRAGFYRRDGYLCIGVNRVHYLGHRLAWLWVHGEWPKFHIDHINGNKSDNRIANLRDVDRKQNLQNSKPHRDNSSGYMGVCWHQKAGKWVASIWVDGKSRYLGVFEDKLEAAREYAKAKTDLHSCPRYHGKSVIGAACEEKRAAK